MNYLKDKFFVGLLKLIFIRYFMVFIRMTIFHCKENERNINGYYDYFLNKKDFFSKTLIFRVGYSIFSGKTDNNVI